MSELKQQGHCKGFVSLGRWWPQQECQKSSKFILAKEQLCTCSILLGTFFSFSTTTWNCLVSRFIEEVIGTLSEDDGDSNKNGKKGIGLISKTTTLHVHHITLCVPSLHDYEVRAPISRFVEDVNTRQRLSFSFPVLWHSPLEFNSRQICQHLTNCTRWSKHDPYFYQIINCSIPFYLCLLVWCNTGTVVQRNLQEAPAKR